MQEAGVVIAGGGVVGLTTALGLARAGVQVTVYDAAEIAPMGTADSVYHWSVLPVFAELDVLDGLVAAGTTSSRWAFAAPERDTCVTFDLEIMADEIEHPYHLTIQRDAIVGRLVDALAAHPSVRVVRGTTVTAVSQDPHGVTVELDGARGLEQVRASWIVGADGAGSRVRRSLGLGLAGHTWPERLVSTTIGFDLASLGGPPYQSWLGHRPGVANLIPADGPGAPTRWRFAYPELRSLPDDGIRSRMAAVFAEILPGGADPRVVDWSAYRMHERVVETFCLGRALLVGDAAHLTNPTSGLGMATGLFDAASVVEHLPRVLDGADTETLERACDERRLIFRDQVSPASTERRDFLFNATTPDLLDARVQWLREIAASRDATRSMIREQTRLVREPLGLGSR